MLEIKQSKVYQDSKRHETVSHVTFTPDGSSRSVLVIKSDNIFFSMLADLLAEYKADPAEFILHEALAIGLEYLWRRDSGCECICAEESAEWPLNLADLDA